MTLTGTTHENPLVSIGVPVYNGGIFLRETLDSLLAQDYNNFELIISDNASTDETEEICLEYSAREPRIRYVRNETNKGSTYNFNSLFRSSSGEYFMWAADHDRWEPSFVSRCVEVMERDPSVSLCYPQAAWIDTEGKHLEDIPLLFDTRGLGKLARFRVVLWGLNNNYVIYGLIRSSALRGTRLFGTSIGPDVVLLAELALPGTFACIPETLFYLRRLPDHGSWEAQASKLNKQIPSRWPAFRLYRELILDYLRVVRRHDLETRSRIERGATILSVFLDLALRYLWVLRGFTSSKESRGLPEILGRYYYPIRHPLGFASGQFWKVAKRTGLSDPESTEDK